MKKELTLLLAAVCCLAAPGFAQSCDQKLKDADAAEQHGDYLDALLKYNAVRKCDANLEAAVETKLEAMFKKIDELRKDAVINEKKARDAERTARKAEADAIRQRDSVTILNNQVDSLAKKFKELENTFVPLMTTGLQYFKFDTIAQSRDYFNALTYFALARFLKPSEEDAELDNLINASQLGVEADKYFLAGKLDSAQQKYLEIKTLLDNPDYETWRLGNIQEVRGLFEAFRQQYKNLTDSVVLSGNWRTIPEQFGSYADITHITFQNNKANWKKFPGTLFSLGSLQTLTITGCPNIKNLYNWDDLPRLRSIALTDNLNLYSIGGLDSLGQLTALEIDACPALTTIEGCKHLETLSVKRSPQARALNLLQNNLGLKHLLLADLPENNFDSKKLNNLEELTLANIKETNLTGLEKNSRLQFLKIDNLDSLTDVAPPNQLKDVHINSCDNITGLNHWPASANLTKIVLYNNSKLKKLPDWQSFPNIENMLLQSNNSLSRTGNLKSLKNADRLFILNNPKIIANAVNIGVSFDFLKFEGVKIEFEHRRRFFKRHDIGIKAALSYHRGRGIASDSTYYSKADYNALIPAVTFNYYSPFHFYYGFGLGVANLKLKRSLTRYYAPIDTISINGNSLTTIIGRKTDRLSIRSFHYTWVNSLGFQMAPNFLKRDKINVNVDLHTVFKPGEFAPGEYFIFVSVGIVYSHILGLNKKTHFIRPSDNRQHVRLGKQKIKIEDLPERF